MTKEDKTIKELKRVNHKIKNEMRLLEIRLYALQYKNQGLKLEIERLIAESTKWESKFYEEVKKNDKAIEYIENCHGMYRNTIGDIQPMINIKPVLDILKGVDKE